MLSILILMVGKTRAAFLREGLDFYLQRLRPYLRVSLVAVKEEKPRSGLTPELIRGREGDRLLARVPSPARLVALDVRGAEFSSEGFAAWLAAKEQAGSGPLVFLVGGHLGLAPAVLAAAGERLALSRMTFTHELARLLLLEQLYRAATIRAGHPYHL